VPLKNASLTVLTIVRAVPSLSTAPETLMVMLGVATAAAAAAATHDAFAASFAAKASAANRAAF
jgi:hypothetical protein